MLARPAPHPPSTAPLAGISLRRGLSVDIFAREGGGPASDPPTVALPPGVALPATLARLLSGMNKEATRAGLEPALSLR